MLRVSLGVAVLALASLVVGFLVVTDSLAFIHLAVGLAIASVLLLLLGLVIRAATRRT